MFSPAKLVTAAAVAALSGALLLAGPFANPVDDPASPAALSDLPPAALVSGQAAGTPEDWKMGTIERHDWGLLVHDDEVDGRHPVDAPLVRAGPPPMGLAVSTASSSTAGSGSQGRAEPR